MGSTRTQVVTQISQTLEDNNIQVWGEEQIEKAIDDGLIEIAQWRPYICKATVIAQNSSNEIDVSTISNALCIDEVRHGGYFRNFRQRGGSIELDVYESAYPSSGDTVEVWYASPHQLNDTSTINTLNWQEERILVELVAAKIAITKPLEFINNHILADHFAAASTAILEAGTAITGGTVDLGSARTALNLVPPLILTGGTVLLGMSTAILEASTAIATASTQADLAPSLILQASTIIASASTWISQGTADLQSGTQYMGTAYMTAQIAKAQSAILAAATAIENSTADLASARARINLVNVGGNPEDDWMQAAMVEFSAARASLEESEKHLMVGRGYDVMLQQWIGVANSDLSMSNQYLTQADGYLKQANADASMARVYAALAAQRMNIAGGHLAQTGAHWQQATQDERLATDYGNLAQRQLALGVAQMQKARANLEIARSRVGYLAVSNEYEAWGRRKLNDVKADLKRISLRRETREYPKD